MKKLLTICLAVFVFAACGPKTHYVINGVANSPEMDGATVYFYAEEVIDSTIVKDGTFSFEGEIAEPTITLIYIETAKPLSNGREVVMLEPGTIHVDFDRDTVYGTPLNDDFYAMLSKHNYNSVMKQAWDKYIAMMEADPVSRPALEEEFYNFRESDITPCVTETFRDMLKSYPDNILGAFAARQLCQEEILDLSELEQIITDTNSVLGRDPVLKKKLTQFRNIAATAEGKHFLDFECILANGEMGHLSDVIGGKLALVDFWASWCAPCREEIRTNLIRLASKYESKGLVVVGVDVWDSPEKHADAVKELGITYPQVIDTTTNATTMYGISGIPHIMLIGPDGTILARELRGELIEDAIVNAIDLK